MTAARSPICSTGPRRLRAVGIYRKAGEQLQRSRFRFWQEHPTTIDQRFTSVEWELELELADGDVQRFPFVVTPEPSDTPIEVRIR